MALHDNEAKARLGYKDRRSKVYPDGREVLYGKDWTKRKKELSERCEGRCEWETLPGGPSDAPVIRCRSEAHDPHHRKPRSKGRDDRLDNLIALCRLHHDILDWKKLHWSKGRAA